MEFEFRTFENGEFRKVDELYHPDRFFHTEGYQDGYFWEKMPNKLFVVDTDEVPKVVVLSYDGEKLYDYNSRFQYTHIVNPRTQTLYPVSDIEAVMTNYPFDHPCYENTGAGKLSGRFGIETKVGYRYVRRDNYEQIINDGLFKLRQQEIGGNDD